MDGRASAACVAKYLKDYNRSKFIECNYTERLDFSVVDLETTVYFVDYSFSSNTVETLFKLLETGCNVIWIDHHFSSLNVFKDFKLLLFNNLLKIQSFNIAPIGSCFFIDA